MKPAGLRLLAFLFSGRHSLAACCDAILQIIHHMLLAERAPVFLEHLASGAAAQAPQHE
jgi:hypothetical protein